MIFGKFDINEDFSLLNRILSLERHYTYSKEVSKQSIDGSWPDCLIKKIDRIEFQIARDKDKLSKHYKQNIGLRI